MFGQFNDGLIILQANNMTSLYFKCLMFQMANIIIQFISFIKRLRRRETKLQELNDKVTQFKAFFLNFEQNCNRTVREHHIRPNDLMRELIISPNCIFRLIKHASCT